MPPTPTHKPSGKIGLFPTCLVDFFRPEIGMATVSLLEGLGFEVELLQDAVCCGQPSYNSGDTQGARQALKLLIANAQPWEHLVVPSGSCAGMLTHHAPALLEDDPTWAEPARALAAKTCELVTLLERHHSHLPTVAFPHKVTYHDSCSGLRELGIQAQPRKLLQRLEGLELVEMDNAEVCCGFGGTFCVKYGAISTQMVTQKVQSAHKTGADVLLAGDLGCLLHMAGRIERLGLNLRCFHIVEALAGMADTALIPSGSTP